MLNKNQNSIIRLANAKKSFDNKLIINDLTLDIYDGEFVTILGPSGCGKTTVLRVLAGLETLDSGDVYLENKCITHVPAEKRNTNTVFQGYALFPHMTVFENIAFGLRMKKTAASEITQRVNDILAIVKLTDFKDRQPGQLSGGQQQRVAIARAVINQPKVLLLDESLSALDYKLRKEMQNELKMLQRKLNITFIFVTHDQEEALSMSNRVIVMSNGKIEQIGTPRDVYETPKNLFVARFVGDINILDGTVKKVKNDKLLVRIEDKIDYTFPNDKNFLEGDKVKILLRPEDLRIETIKDSKDPSHSIIGVVEATTYKGATLDSIIKIPKSKKIRASEFFDEDDEDFEYKNGEKVTINWVKGWEVLLKNDE